MCHVITGENVDRFRVKAILYALKLESKGLKGKVRASTIARDMLAKANIKPEKTLIKLFEQFKLFVGDL